MTFVQCAVIALCWGAALLVGVFTWRWARDDGDFEQLYAAVRRNELLPVIGLLKRHPGYTNRFRRPDGYTPFMVACAHANTQMVKFMLWTGADLTLKSAHNETPFYLASFYYIQHKTCKDASCIRELYRAGADINEPGPNGVTPLELAATFGHTPLVKWLLAKRAAMRAQRRLYLMARSCGHHDTANQVAKWRPPS